MVENSNVTAESIDGHLFVTCSRCTALFVRHNACTDECDFNVGPCACGAWHHNDHRCPACEERSRSKYQPTEWDDYFLAITRVVATKSKDQTKVGALIVGPDREIRSTGYNGFPRGVREDDPLRHERPEKYFWTEHAERNAILHAARTGVPLEGCTMFCTWGPPCMACARAVIQSGITVVKYPAGSPTNMNPKWEEEFRRTRVMMSEAGVRLVEL